MQVRMADAAFRAEINAMERRRHEAYLARLPGDGLATDVLRDEDRHPILDADGNEKPIRVKPYLMAHQAGSSAVPGPSTAHFHSLDSECLEAVESIYFPSRTGLALLTQPGWHQCGVIANLFVHQHGERFVSHPALDPACPVEITSVTKAERS